MSGASVVTCWDPWCWGTAMGRSSGDGPPESRATFLSTVMREYGCGKLSTAPGRARWGRPTCRARQGETAGRGTATEGMRDRMAREREPLSRQRVLRCAVEIADAEGLGVSVEMTAHAYALLDTYVHGSAVQEVALPFGGEEGAATVTESFTAQLTPEQYPHLTELAVEHVMRPGYGVGAELEFGLGVVLDALERAAASAATAP